MARHRIGLSQAWEQFAGGDAATGVWVRRFGRPTGLGEGDRVLLVIRGATIAAAATLNGSPLAVHGSDGHESGRDGDGTPANQLEWDVTPLIQTRNELVLMQERGMPPPGVVTLPQGADRRPLWPPLGEVSLEIVPVGDQAVA